MRKMKSSWSGWFLDRLPFLIPCWILTMLPLPGNSLKVLTVYMKLFTLLNYDVWKMFSQLKCSLIYEDKAVCSARMFRVKGLATEMCRRTENLARDLGCTHTYASVSGSTGGEYIFLSTYHVCRQLIQKNVWPSKLYLKLNAKT